MSAVVPDPATTGTPGDASVADVAARSADETLDALDALGDAAALGDADGRRVLGTTVALRRLLGASVAADRPPPDDWPTLHANVDALLGRAGDAGTLTERRLPDGRRVLRVDGRELARGDARRYLAERDDLFLTSRTISVSEMATTLAHELNQPIGTLANLLTGLRLRGERGALEREATVPTLDAALEQTRYAQSVIARIRDFTESRRPEQRRLDARELIERAGALLDWLFASSATELELSLPEEPLFVRGDATMLQQVLINLLRNAVDAMRDDAPGSRTVTVTAWATSGTVAIAVRDRGHGIDDRENTLFVPFVTGKPDGMGVGLNICRSFLELHQGRLWLAPAPDGGCVAHVELPAAPMEESDGAR